MIDILTIHISVSIADIISNFLGIPGQFIRDILLSINLHIAKSLFIIYFLSITYWVYNLPKSEVILNNKNSGKDINLKPFAISAMVMIIIIYLVF
ncbi:hypothetical protein OAK14_01595 [Candidatus Marinimicrobia bacterium]|nr:hypothetical protein [Candidatus Neomarinimicrobiota bacterium]RZP30785.1 MAG: hypothetical protein EVA23_02075 [bacterium]|tara:strand:+ start:8471 stop:8755 length:285 start_codon:yes stop_codon:yes gene_type:complete